MSSGPERTNGELNDLEALLSELVPDGLCELRRRRALKEWMKRMEEAAWPTPLEGTLGGPTLYLCSVERRVHIVVHLMKDGLARVAEFGREQGLGFQDACNFLGGALDDAATTWPSYSREVNAELILFSALYLLGTQAYQIARRLNTNDQFLIFQYRNASTKEPLLRPVPITRSELVSPAELEELVESTLEIDRVNHPERFRRAKLLPFRLRSREVASGATSPPSPPEADDTFALGNSNMPAPLRERLRTVKKTAQRNLQAILERIGDEEWAQIEARIHALVDSRDPPWVRLRGLYAIADGLLKHVEGHAACRRGCAHCCHIRVDLVKTEAEMLGSAIRRKPKTPAVGNFDTFDAGYHQPCTFLSNGECSIYEHRPLACRVHVNLDEDALLCEINEWSTKLSALPGLAIKETFDWAYGLICGTSRHADIREYFPPAQNSEKPDSTRPIAP